MGEVAEDAVVVNAFSLHPAFVYDDKRKLNKLCLIFKMIGFGFYSRTAVTCLNDKLFPWLCMVSCMMFGSICNTIRYEYAFHKIYGTTFQSIEVFKEWKTRQTPQIKPILDCVEFIIKAVYLYKSFPLTFDMYDENNDKQFSVCRFSGTLLKLHILVIMAVYSIGVLLLMCFYTDVVLRRMSSPRQPRDAVILNSAVNQTMVQVVPTAVMDAETECCICLDKNEEPWTTARCMHSFHAKCMSEWMKQNPSCPICRSSLVV
jgi:hypothetical protein